MQLVSYKNTMNGARPVQKLEAAIETTTRSIFQIRAERRAELRRLRLEEERLSFERMLAEANEAIKRANIALRKFHGSDVTVSTITTRICRALNVSRHDVLSDRRDSELVFARQAIFYWVCRRTGRSLPQIGRLFNRDHTTILHGKRIYREKRARMGRRLREVR